MCGITGFIDFSHRSSKEQLVAMTDSLTHRGPDASGYEFFNNEAYQVGLGHRRLSILDLSENGHQPMYSSDGQHAIVYNGEVYNFPEIRSWLQTKGYRFKSNSDTEVVLHALIEEGVKAIDRFIGMFAIAFLDIKANRLTLIRDRTGVKPLFFIKNSNSFLFSSEVRAFHKHSHFHKRLNFEAVQDYLDHGYIGNGKSVFENIQPVTPGCIIELNLSTQSIQEKRYWSIYDYYQKPRAITKPEAVDELEHLLKDACRLRMVSDVPVGVFLSGGIDSSTIAAVLQNQMSSRLSTFTIGFENEVYNEAPKAKRIAQYLGTDHHELYCTEGDLLNIFPRLPGIYDEPFADKSAIPTVLVSEFTRKHVKVALSADGGDEAFAGYNKYVDLLQLYVKLGDKNKGSVKSRQFFFKKIYGLSKALPSGLYRLKDKIFQLNQNIAGYPSITDLMINKSKFFGKNELSNLLGNHYVDSEFLDLDNNKTHSDLSDLLASDFNNYLLNDILIKLDRATMSVGLEGREPLLDHRVTEFAASLPDDFKLNGSVSKHLLREVNKLYLPTELTSGAKQGFSIPKNDWLVEHLGDYVNYYLSDKFILDQGIFERKYTRHLLSLYKIRRGHNRIWNLVLFNMWYEKWM
jgi:asparagine synthase (glutamine-hydrolysing)